MNRRETGALGEITAAGYLKKLGYSIVETNYRCRLGEIDIVARDGDCLAFVEVRSKTSLAQGTPEESITPRKMARLRNAAMTYLERFEEPPDWRIDCVAIEFDRSKRPRRINLIKSAVGEG